MPGLKPDPMPTVPLGTLRAPGVTPTVPSAAFACTFSDVATVVPLSVIPELPSVPGAPVLSHLGIVLIVPLPVGALPSAAIVPVATIGFGVHVRPVEHVTLVT